MIEQPERYISDYAKAGADVLTVHVEATKHLHRAVQMIRGHGIAAGAALNPASPTSLLHDVLPDLDVALVMTVNPGAGGQRFINSMIPKIELLRAEIERRSLKAAIQVDGGIDVETAPLVTAAGATQLVAGSAVYGSGEDVGEAYRRLLAAALEGISG
jgi:ribulose-phosphate 3-epimerase